MKFKQYLIICLYDLFVVGLFVFLSVSFNRWWIVLFGILFMRSTDSIKCIHKFYRICDRCGKTSEYADTYKEALDKAVNNGWVHYEEDNLDYCPDCKEYIKYIKIK